MSQYLTLIGIDQPPVSARLVMSGERDANFLEATFDGWLPFASLQRSVWAAYGGTLLWLMGPAESDYMHQQGKRTTRVRFRAGPYRYAKNSAAYIGRYLYDVLETEWQNDAIGAAPTWAASLTGTSSRVSLWDQLSPPAPLRDPNDEPIARTAANVTETHLRLLALNGNIRLDAVSEQEQRTELRRQINADALIPSGRRFDDVVRHLAERWQIMLRVDNPNYLATRTEAQLYADRDAVRPPPLFGRCLLDEPSVHYTADELTNIPILDDITFQAPINQRLRDDEDTLVSFAHRTGGPPIPGDVLFGETATDGQLNAGENYWRWEDVDRASLLQPVLVVKDTSEIPAYQSANPHTLLTARQMPSYHHAALQSRLLRQQAFWPNRLRTVTAVAPADADTLRQLLPGLPVRVRSLMAQTDEGAIDYAASPVFWVLETSISTPPFTMTVQLVKPGVWNGDFDAGLTAPSERTAPTESPT